MNLNFYEHVDYPNNEGEMQSNGLNDERIIQKLWLLCHWSPNSMQKES